MALNLSTKVRYGAYDFANSGFLLIFQSLLFPIVLAQSTSAGVNGTNISLWGWLVAASSVLAIISSPFMGKLADHVGRPTIFRLLVIATALGGVLSGFLTHSTWLLALSFLIFNSLFELSQTTYDAFLPRLTATQHETNTLSAFAWGFGYLGGALFAGLFLVLDRLNVPYSAILSLTSITYLIASVPALRLTTERDTPPQVQRPSLRQLLHVHPPVPWRQLISYWLIADAVAALTYFLPLYLSRELNFSLATIGILMLGGQLIAFPATAYSGRLVNRFNHRIVIGSSLLVWIVALGLLISSPNLPAVSLAVGVGALVFGTTQATLRSHYAQFLHPGEPAQGFGFYAVAQKSASILAPAAGALLATSTGSLRPVIIFVAGLICLALFLSRKLPHAPQSAAHT